MKYLSLFLLPAMVITLSCSSKGAGSTPEGYATRSSEGEVSFQLTPQTVVNGKFTVNLRVDTHSGDLADLDLREAMTLHAADKTYKPVSGSSLSGHHATGSVAFDIERIPDSFFIIIAGVRNMKELKFEWP